MRFYLNTFKQYWIRHVLVGVSLFIIIFSYLHEQQSTKYSVEGLIQIGNASGLIGSSGSLMSFEETKQLISYAVLPKLSKDNSFGIDERDEHISVRLNNQNFFVMRASATSPDRATQIYREAIDTLFTIHNRIYQAKVDNLNELFLYNERQLLAQNKILLNLKNCSKPMTSEANTICWHLLYNAIDSLNKTKQRKIELKNQFLTENLYPTRQIGELKFITPPIFSYQQINILLAFYITLLVISIHNLLLCHS